MDVKLLLFLYVGSKFSNSILCYIRSNVTPILLKISLRRIIAPYLRNSIFCVWQIFIYRKLDCAIHILREL